MLTRLHRFHLRELIPIILHDIVSFCGLQEIIIIPEVGPRQKSKRSKSGVLLPAAAKRGKVSPNRRWRLLELLDATSFDVLQGAALSGFIAVNLQYHI